ncbi:kinetochore-associated Ndc80 complex subunit nuf2 [Tilletia horrida]|uniref:Kinetochore-associated Ndc80 complex subunit nuf2 n=1 Tax=Tilletia horrida TaxID=155126 RepID=A0AAN6GG95_9BASI|nr:kinetochore-associated Ndc80 complex subunit nuf2 [Tilletia horrida]KAK0533090.1 kinetochore-associated Ndc80 complex subunit nuf2 [Tilletia horrida]KAK0539929.1 kinetochore-associated Ndc80 complex subunit nuf2 [Tilletia horrida]KAK0565221.1 kinetochore-associated Ndc80 complex subunit nuf2 [Tilletia horrida]
MANASTAAKQDGGAAQDASSSFPLLNTAEILPVLGELGLTISAEDIAKPTLAVTTKVFMAFLDSLSGSNQEWIEERAKMVNQLDYREIYPDGLYWRIFYRELNELLIASQVRDFAFSDIARPQTKRFKRQLSALVNFWRFKQDRMTEFVEIANEEIERETRRDNLLQQVELKRARIAEIKAQREAEREAVLALRAQNQAGKDVLMQLKLEQKKLMDRMEQLRKEKQELLQRQTDLHYQIQLAITDIRKLSGRTVTSPKKLKGSLDQMHEQLVSAKKDMAADEQTARALESKRDVLMGLESELKACITLLESLEVEKNRIAKERNMRDKVQEAIEQCQTDIRDADTVASQVTRQISSASDRQQRLKKAYDDKRAAYKAKMESTNAALLDLNRRKAEMMEKAKAKNRETAALEAEFDRLQEEYQAFCNERMQERNSICALAEFYMVSIARARHIDFDE